MPISKGIVNCKIYTRFGLSLMFVKGNVYIPDKNTIFVEYKIIIISFPFLQSFFSNCISFAHLANVK